MSKRDVLIFGAFNPITNAHVNMGISAFYKFNKKVNVVYIPAGDDYLLSNWKHLTRGDIIPFDVRCKLVGEAVSEHGFRVSRVSEQGEGRVYPLLKNFNKPIICVGADKLKDLHLWYEGEKLVAENNFIVVWRDGEKGKLDNSLKKYESHFIDSPCVTEHNTSSTRVREAVKASSLESIKGIIPDCVYQYYKQYRK